MTVNGNRTMIEKLAGAERAAAIGGLEGWSEAEDRDAIRKTFRFADFNAAFAFMARVAMMAEKTDHHLEWFNVYDRVEVTLSNYDASGVTGRDIRLAQFMDPAAS
ncbi:MAG TPA: 4a-hydroxytetrahydrobiopterin dehydratase [Rhodospirillales bacterium]|jgi:4a-hydroxytetrahydrobiopterin dehydratase|nr:4a-hydroxytetrahydrobiopterin dehydratase [Rhodospirillales bacterium]